MAHKSLAAHPQRVEHRAPPAPFRAGRHKAQVDIGRGFEASARQRAVGYRGVYIGASATLARCALGFFKKVAGSDVGGAHVRVHGVQLAVERKIERVGYEHSRHNRHAE